jgi:hypothetical protein
MLESKNNELIIRTHSNDDINDSNASFFIKDSDKNYSYKFRFSHFNKMYDGDYICKIYEPGIIVCENKNIDIKYIIMAEVKQ